MQHVDEGEAMELALALIPTIKESSDLSYDEALIASRALVIILLPIINRIIDRRG